MVVVNFVLLGPYKLKGVLPKGGFLRKRVRVVPSVDTYPSQAGNSSMSPSKLTATISGFPLSYVTPTFMRPFAFISGEILRGAQEFPAISCTFPVISLRLIDPS